MTTTAAFLARTSTSTDHSHNGTPCVAWTGPARRHGYGSFSPPGVRGTVSAHRWAYMCWIGPIADGLVIDHLCTNKWCVNPYHLEPVTQRENVLRGTAPAAINATKTHCIHGHEFTPENTRVNSKGWRRCVACIAWRRKLRRSGQVASSEDALRARGLTSSTADVA